MMSFLSLYGIGVIHEEAIEKELVVQMIVRRNRLKEGEDEYDRKR
jgi:hypothetical protein